MFFNVHTFKNISLFNKKSESTFLFVKILNNFELFNSNKKTFRKIIFIQSLMLFYIRNILSINLTVLKLPYPYCARVNFH